MTILSVSVYIHSFDRLNNSFMFSYGHIKYRVGLISVINPKYFSELIMTVLYSFLIHL